ncbi:MAG: 50S ribosomal protein L22 [Patescibacteria group bacterium]|nr:50S ribosomal protein L22 [Patescibacteria group bacterium]MDD5221588.1 50S ribosomal protein L22 [Patescibacteria group bacterium]MDD5396031.1 50S ribosomal protein L22 [Patescibacteria group bacterium]
MEVRAIARHLRISPKKMRLVVDVVRNLSVTQAEDQLQFVPRRGSAFILKVLRSALANAEYNFNFKKDNLFIKKIIVNEGPALKRWMPKAFGRATPLKKRSSHLEIILAEYKPTAKIEKNKAVEANKIKTDGEAVVENELKERRDSGKKHLIDAKDKKIKPKRAGVKSKIFSRKAI